MHQRHQQEVALHGAQLLVKALFQRVPQGPESNRISRVHRRLIAPTVAGHLIAQQNQSETPRCGLLMGIESACLSSGNVMRKARRHFSIKLGILRPPALDESRLAGAIPAIIA